MHRSFSHPARIWLVPLLGVLALVAFPAGAGAATPTPTPCATPPASASPCYTAAPAVVPSSEWTNPPEGRILTVPLTPPQTGSPGTWSGTAPIRYTYQWQDCDAATGLTCTNISGATSRTYTVAPTDVGSRLQFVVTATNPAGTGYAVLESAGAAAAAVPINRQAPTISGVTQDGQTLTSSTGLWNGSMPISYTYQWQRCDGAGLNCGKPGPSSPSNTYALTDGDLGHILVAYVTATNSAGSASTHSHVTTTVVTPGNTAAPTISGTAQAGQKLTESHGSWIPKSPTGYSYQWQDCDASGANCTAIAGATTQTYTPANADVGHTLRVLESATASGVTSSPATSGATGVVKAGSTAGGGTGGGTTGGGTTGGGTTGGGGSGGTVTLSASRIRGLLRNVLALHGKAGTIRGVLNHAGYSFSFTAPSPGRLVLDWYFAPKHGKKVLVAAVTLVFHSSGKATAKIVLTGKGRRVLSGTRRMKLTAKGSFTPAGHGAISTSRQITLKA